MADDLLGTSFTDPDAPDLGTGLWYLVRGVNACAGAGPYGFQGLRGAQGAPEISVTCP